MKITPTTDDVALARLNSAPATRHVDPTSATSRIRRLEETEEREARQHRDDWVTLSDESLEAESEESDGEAPSDPDEREAQGAEQAPPHHVDVMV